MTQRLLQPGPSGPIDPADLYFLILHFLAEGRCHQATAALQEEAAKHGLLPTRLDVYGKLVRFAMQLCDTCICCVSESMTVCACAGERHQLSYEELKRRYQHISPRFLEQLVASLLECQRELHEGLGVSGRFGFTSLLDRGPPPSLCSTTMCCSLPGAGHTLHAALVVSAAAPCAPQAPSACSTASVRRRPRLREVGWSRAIVAGGALQSPLEFAGQLRHQRTVRGHHFAVYCIAWDRSGRRIITGSDDRLVKVCAASPACEAPAWQ